MTKFVVSDEVLASLKENYDEALKDVNFKKLTDSLKVDENVKMFNNNLDFFQDKNELINRTFRLVK